MVETKRGIQKENEEIKKQIHSVFGWHFLAKEISDFTNDSFFKIMETSALEIAGLTALIKAKQVYGK